MDVIQLYLSKNFFFKKKLDELIHLKKFLFKFFLGSTRQPAQKWDRLSYLTQITEAVLPTPPYLKLDRRWSGRGRAGWPVWQCFSMAPLRTTNNQSKCTSSCVFDFCKLDPDNKLLKQCCLNHKIQKSYFNKKNQHITFN